MPGTSANQNRLTSTKSRATRKRKPIEVKYEEEDFQPTKTEEVKEKVEEETPTPKKAKSRQSPMKKPIVYKPPENWRTLYDTLKKFRYEQLPPAPVDTLGCDMLFTQHATEKERRFQILLSLLLSSQTKDPVTAAAMQKLHLLANSKTGSESGITVSTVLNSSDAEVDGCISKVGFHHKKTKYMRQVAEICRGKYGDDIPGTIEELLELPGVGPKMGYLALQSAWGRIEGIGVDTHVHRISSRLKWVPRGTEEKGPEATREVLEGWLPKELWGEVNHLLVGLGQTVCVPRNPKCGECAAAAICPSSSVKRKLKKEKDETEE